MKLDLANVLNKRNLSSTIASANISNIIGGESSFVYNYFRSKFPDGFFKDTYISQQLNSFKFGSPFPSQKLPLLAMGTNYEIQDSLMGDLSRMYTTMYTVRTQNKDKYYRPIFRDEDHDIYIYSVDNRSTLRHNFAIKLQTQAQAWNVINYINQNFETNGRNYLNNIRLPAVLPNSFILNICENFGWNINSQDENTARRDREELRAYLIKYGLGGITEQVNPETGAISYMYDYTTNILLTFPDMAEAETNTTDLIIKNSLVRYQISSEFWFPGSFIIDFDKNFNFAEKEEDTLNNMTAKFTLVLAKNIIPKSLDNGFKYIRQARYTPDINQTVDKMSIDNFFDQGIMNIVSSSRKYNLELNKLIKFILFKNNKPMQLGEDYEVDFDKMEIRVKNPSANENYTLTLYGNIEKLNILNEYIISKNDREIKKMDIFPDTHL